MTRNRRKSILTLLCIALVTWIAPAISAEIPSVDPDKGLVVFYRLKSFKGGVVRFSINHSEGSIGQLTSGTYLYKYLDPGEHTFWSQAISKDSITLTVEAGQVYFVKGNVRMGVFVGRPKFTQVSESTAKTDLAKLQ